MLRFFVKLAIFLAVVGILGGVSYGPAMKYWRLRNKPKWQTVTVVRGDAIRTINTTGRVKPVLSISVGSFVSGPITELHVDFNAEVEKGQLLAEVDPRLFKANVARDEATLATREAEVNRVKAQLQQAINNKERGQLLRQKNEDYLSDREMDALRFECEALEAQLKLAEAAVQQAKANLENSAANLEYTLIKSPEDGVVIDRKIDPGQTLAAAFQTPELFVIAPDLREEVHIFASVDEQDIGLIQRAKDEGRPVTFTVDAYPEDLFEGTIQQIRVSSVEVQNVVTYPVVVSASNPDLKLLPGMTASVSFEVDSAMNVLKVPTSALRFMPEDEKYVREEDRDLLDGSRWKSTNESANETILSAEEKAEAQRKKNERHVWMDDGENLRAVPIVTGISDSKYMVLVSGDLKEGDELVENRERS
jgi:HlyD family secretion protein